MYFSGSVFWYSFMQHNKEIDTEIGESRLFKLSEIVCSDKYVVGWKIHAYDPHYFWLNIKLYFI